MAGTFTNQSGPSVTAESIIDDVQRLMASMPNIKKLTLWRWYLAPPDVFMKFDEPNETIFAADKATWEKAFSKGIGSDIALQLKPFSRLWGTEVIDLAHNPDEEARARRLMMAKLEKLAVAEMEQMNNMGLKFSGLAYGNLAAFKNPKDSK